MKAPMLTIGLLAVALSALADDGPDKRSSEAEAVARKRRETIEEEIQSCGPHEWAGRYYYGDGLGANILLLLAPSSGHLFEWHGCLGLYDRNYGAIAVTGQTLHLSFTFANERRGFQGIANSFIPVHWGDRTYLIPPEDMIEFCNAINSGLEPRADMHGHFLLRDRDALKTVTGFPEVPAEYTGYLLNEPIEAQIISVGKNRGKKKAGGTRQEIAVWLDAGAQDGLLPGMELHVITPEKHQFESVILTTNLEDHVSEAMMTIARDRASLPKPGWRLSTRVGWKN